MLSGTLREPENDEEGDIPLQREELVLDARTFVVETCLLSQILLTWLLPMLLRSITAVFTSLLQGTPEL